MSHGSTGRETRGVELTGRADEGRLPRSGGPSATAPWKPADSTPAAEWVLVVSGTADTVSAGLLFTSPIPPGYGCRRQGPEDLTSRRRSARCGPIGRGNREFFRHRIESDGHPGSIGGGDINHGDARQCVEDRLTRQVLRIDQIVERLRMKLNRSRRDASILENPGHPDLIF